MRGALRDRGAGSSGQRRRPRAEGTGRGAAVCGPAARRVRAGLPGRAGRAAEPTAGPSSAAASRGHGKMAAPARGQMAALAAAGQRRLRRARSRRPGGSAAAGPLPPARCWPGAALGQPWAATPRLPGELPGVGSAAHREIGKRTDGLALDITKPRLAWEGRARGGRPARLFCLLSFIFLIAVVVSGFNSLPHIWMPVIRGHLHDRF